MNVILSKTYKMFFRSGKSSGLWLVACTIVAMSLANSPLGPAYAGFWQQEIAGLRLELWVNDALMAVFFLFVGLELEREFYSGELSDFSNAILPIFAAVGGIALPALMHFALNHGTPTQGGAGIPMATDIAFALAVLALLGSRIPASLKIFLTALAVIDDLGAIIVIAIFYSGGVSMAYLAMAMAVFGLLCALNRFGRIYWLWPYLLGGAAMWFLMLKSGIHPTIAGVMLAFAIPYSSKDDDESSPSHRLEGFLHWPVAFLILPLFALANTGIVLASDWQGGLLSANSLGIAAGLVIGKPFGIVALSFVGVALGLCKLPGDLAWRHIAGAGFLGGIGFTMSIFITNLAFADQAAEINAAKLAIVLASSAAGVLGYLWLRWATRDAGVPAT